MKMASTNMTLYESVTLLIPTSECNFLLGLMNACSLDTSSSIPSQFDGWLDGGWGLGEHTRVPCVLSLTHKYEADALY